jgi:ABC-type glutathione transport system ATPase component
LNVAAGELVALVGESGAGKTSVAAAVLGLVKVHSGSVVFQGSDVTQWIGRSRRSLRRRMQVVFQDPYAALNPRATVRTTVREALVVHRIGTSAERRERVVAALTKVGLTPPEPYLDRYPRELSGGQRQRVALAASLVVRPDLLIADEPLSMVDVASRVALLSLLDTLREDGLAILSITHDIATAARFADRVAVMYAGRIVEAGSSSQVTSDPRHAYTQALLSVAPRHDTNGRGPGLYRHTGGSNAQSWA